MIEHDDEPRSNGLPVSNDLVESLGDEISITRWFTNFLSVIAVVTMVAMFAAVVVLTGRSIKASEQNLQILMQVEDTLVKVENTLEIIDGAHDPDSDGLRASRQRQEEALELLEQIRAELSEHEIRTRALAEE